MVSRRSHNRGSRDHDEQAPTNEDGGEMNYQSFSDATETTTRTEPDCEFRGFSTSINDMFTDPASERIDCCAMACCGVLQNDRDRYLVTGIEPPSCCRRVWIHMVMPFWIFSMAMFCALQIPDTFFNSIFSTGFVVALIGYLFSQCMKGMWKRREIRKELLWSKYNFRASGDFRPRTDDDTIEEMIEGESPRYLMGQTRGDIRNGHALCGCYSSDRSPLDFPDVPKDSICTHIFRFFTSCCCGLLCKRHFQLCGVCAVAQEGREIERLIESRYRRIDYVTMQPILEYYPAIYEARQKEGGVSNSIFVGDVFGFWSRLSSFSRWALGTSASVMIFLLVWSLLGIHRHFLWQNYVVFCATLLQAYLVLKIVHWNHVQDISSDALIKFFASGFCLSTTMAVFYELAVGLTMKLSMSIIMAISGIDVMESDGYSMVSPGFANMFSMQESGDSPAYRDYLKVYGKDHPFIYTVYLLVSAFLLAAFIEELCKYFGFRMVEHPDFLSRKQLQEAADAEHDVTNNEQREFPDFERQDRPLESRGAAITVAMVAAALGFACCENLVYIFVYGGSSVDVEVVILIARSIFPVHPIAAALQSIRVCERELEKRDQISLGQIVFPGILFHGLYDFLLMWIDFLASRKANYVEDDDNILDPEGESDWLSFVLSFAVMIVALWYYFRESRRQRERLRGLDQHFSFDQSRLL